MEWDYGKGNLTKRSDIRKGKEETFGYDNLDRLTSANISGGLSFLVNYWGNGNINSKTDAGNYSYHGLGVPAQSLMLLPARRIQTT